MKALAVVLLCGVAAADTYPLSELRTKPRLDVVYSRIDDVYGSDWPCAEYVDSRWRDGWLQGDTWLGDEPLAPAEAAARANGTGASAARERLVASNGGAELRRTQWSDEAHIPLHVVGHAAPGIDVYAYLARDGDGPAVFVLTRTDEGTANLDDDEDLGGGHNTRSIDRASGCGILETSLPIIDGNSRLGELSGALPDGRSFLISASVSKTSRDREPILSVSVRAFEPQRR